MKTIVLLVMVLLLSACSTGWEAHRYSASGYHEGLVDRFDSREDCLAAAREMQEKAGEKGADYTVFCKRV